MGNRKDITSTRVYKDTITEMNKEMPGIRHADIIQMSWQTHKAINKMGKFIYGNVWKTNQKK